MKYRREIDGLRAVAVVPVILFHAGFTVFSGGFVGVDVFFVISGYLITSILIAELERNDFSITRFYERRARRILPALFVVSLACIPFAWLWMLPSQAKNFAQSIVAVVFFVSNVLFWREDGYFEAAAEKKPLLHTWSLAVEEQYYIIFPVFLFLVWRFGRDRVFWLVVAISIGSLLIAEWGWRNEPSANFYLAPTRAWELLAGSICALLTVGRKQRASNLLSLIGLSLIIFAILFYSKNTPFPSIYAFAPVGGTALIILYASRETWVAKFLAMKVFVGIGLISYSAYLWHQPLFAFARIRSLAEPSNALMSALAVLSLALAYLTWRYVEQPFRRRPVPVLPKRSAVFAASGLVGAAFVAFGVAGHRTDGFKGMYALIHSDKVGVMDLIEEVKASHRDPYSLKVAPCVVNFPAINNQVIELIESCFNRNGRGILVLGDSHAIDLFRMIARQKNRNFVIGITQGSCRPHSPKPGCQYEEIISLASKYREVFEFAIYEQAGFYLLRDELGEAGTRKMFRKVPIDGPIPEYSVNIEFVARTIDYLRNLSEHVPVVIFGPRVEPHIPLEILLRTGCEQEIPVRENLFGNFDAIDAELERQADAARLLFVSQNRMIGYDLPGDFAACDRIYWSDGDHLSDEGEKRFSSRLRIVEEAEDYVRALK